MGVKTFMTNIRHQHPSSLSVDHIRHQYRTSKIEKKVKEGTNNESLLNEMKMQFQFQRL